MTQPTDSTPPAWGQTATPQSKNRLNLKLIGGGTALFLIGVLVGTSGGSNDEKNVTAQAAAGAAQQKLVTSTTATTASPTTTTEAPTTTTTEAPTTTTTTTPAARWVKVASITTSSSKESSSFELHGGEQRFRYTCSQGSISIKPQCIVGVKSVDGGPDFNLWASKVESDTSALHLSAGSYYIDASIVGAFTGTVEELRL